NPAPGAAAAEPLASDRNTTSGRTIGFSSPAGSLWSRIEAPPIATPSTSAIRTRTSGLAARGAEEEMDKSMAARHQPAALQELVLRNISIAPIRIAFD